MPTLSLAMIVKNEEAFLGHCLASVQGLVDEIVIVDTGSEDRTLEIAESFGAKLGHFPWAHDFAAARNASLRLCTGDWILILDADEALDAADHPILRTCMEAGSEEQWTLVLRNYFLDSAMTTLDKAATRNLETRYREGRQYDYYADAFAVRLFRNLPGVAFEGAVHESVYDFFHPRGTPIGQSPAVVHHYGKTDRDREAFKVRYYLDLAKQDAEARPRDKQVLFNLVLQAYVAKDWELGLEAARRYLKQSPKAPTLIHLVAAMAQVSLGRPKEAFPHLDGILAAEPRHVMALFQKAMAYAGLDRPKETRDWLRAALKVEPAFVPVYQFWANWEAKQGLWEEARKVLQRGVEANPQDLKLNQFLIQLSMDRGQEAQAVADAWAALQRLPEGGAGHWHHLVAHGLSRQGQAKHAAAVADLGLRAFPDHPGLRELRAQLGAEQP